MSEATTTATGTAVSHVRVALPKIHKQQKAVLNLHNILITAAFDLTLYELRFLLAIGYLVQKNKEHSLSIKVTAKDIASLLGYALDGYYGLLDSITTRLMTAVISINGGENSKDWVKVNFFTRASYKRGELFLELTPESQSFFLSLNGNYTQLSMLTIVSIGSAYSLRLYLRLKHEFRQNRRIIEIDINDFRSLLNIPDDLYEKYSHLKSRIIIPALREIALCSEVSASIEEIKTGKRVTGLKFVIHQNYPQGTLPDFYHTDDAVIEQSKTVKFSFQNFVEWLRYESSCRVGSGNPVCEYEGAIFKFDEKGFLYRTDTRVMPSSSKADELYKKLYAVFKKDPSKFGYVRANPTTMEFLDA